MNFEREADAATLAVLEEARADVVVLQEVTDGWAAILDPLYADSHPHRFFRQEQPDGGMAIYSRHPLRTIRWLPSAAGSFPSWCGDVHSPVGVVRVLAVHLHPPLGEDGRLVTGYLTTSDERLAELEAAWPCLEEAPLAVAVGDFNEESGPATRRLVDAGFEDAAGTGRAAPRSWSWPTPLGTITGRPDHVFAGPGLGVASSRTLPRGGSDHRAVEASLFVR